MLWGVILRVRPWRCRRNVSSDMKWMDRMAVDRHGGFSGCRRGGLGWSSMRMDIMDSVGLGRWC